LAMVETGLVVKSALDTGFLRDACRDAWLHAPNKGCPWVQNCLVTALLNTKHSARDPASKDIMVHSLTLDGYKGLALAATILKYPTSKMAARNISHCGMFFSVNVAGHLTSDDVFLLGRKTWCKKEKKRLMVKKNHRVRLMKIKEKAMWVLETEVNDEKNLIGTVEHIDKCRGEEKCVVAG